MAHTVKVASPVKRSGRVQQVEGMFDVPASEKTELEWEVPDSLIGVYDEADWNIGLIVGPSGSGKSTVARDLWPSNYVFPDDDFHWPEDRAVVDAIDAPIKDTVKMLTAVGFGSPPAWLRPFHVLSTGEQFRAQLARALLELDAPVVDEFTSVVDRQVAKFGSEATAKAVRARGSQLIAVTCHFDVMEWLNPDWVFRPDTGAMEWPRGSLQRPGIELEVRRVGREAWTVFGPHHYLSADLHIAARCAGAFIGDECVAFCAWYRFPHPRAKDIMIASRVVVLPDYQGVGIGARLVEFIGNLLHGEGDRLHITTSHPAFIGYMRRSARWTELKGQNAPSKSAKPKRLIKQHQSLRKLTTRSFEYVPI